jgi:hypothetical protein
MKRGMSTLVPLITGLAFVLVALGVGSLLRKAAGTTMSSQTSPETHVAAPAGKRALLVGIDNYEYPNQVSPLAGSLNDVEEMRQVLITKFGFPPENVLVLKESQATHAGIMNAIQSHLISKTQPGDIVVFHYSGHGSQVPDKTGKMISGLDGTIVPYDSRDPEGKVFDITGAELHTALVQLAAKTKNLTFILDSCHSGTLVRGADTHARVRSIPPDTRNVPASQTAVARGVTVGVDGSSPSFAFISAATSRENAFEHFADNMDHGALTYMLVKQLRSARAGATYRDVMDGVISEVTANYPAQHPSLEGAEADQSVFGDATSLAGSYATASPSLLDPRRVTLGIGQVHGATAGSIYDVYAPGSKKLAPPERPVAKVQLASVEALSSEAVVLSGGKVAPASRAVEREHRYGGSRTRVYIDRIEDSPTLQSIQAALGDSKFIEIVSRPTQCQLQLRQVGQSIQTLAADSSTLSPPVPVTDSAVVDRVIGQLKGWAKWFNVLSIRNAQTGIDVSFNIKGSQTRDPMARVGKPDMGVFEGETVDATFSNNGDRDLYVALLDLSSDGSIAVVYPSQGSEEVLKPHLTLSKTLRTTLPKGRSNVTDVLKVFASYKPIDLTPLTQGRVRGFTDDPLNELLMDSAGVSRGVTPVLSGPVDLGTWTTTQRVLRVNKKKD